MTRTRRSAVLVLITLALALTATARVISYSPYTDRTAFTAHQARSNRFFALVEAAPSPFGPQVSASYGQLVVYDSTGEQAPRVVFPKDGSYAIFTLAAARESSDGTLALLVQSGAQNSVQSGYVFNLSTDGGATWKPVDLPSTVVSHLLATGADTGGPFTASRYSPVRVGNSEYPFVVLATSRLYAVRRDGSTKVLFDPAAGGQSPVPVPPPYPTQLALAGTNSDGTRFILRTNSGFITVGLDGSTQTLTTSLSGSNPPAEGFIANDGSVYLEERSTISNGGKLWFYRNGTKESLLDISWTDQFTQTAFAVPSADYSGAWIIQRVPGQPTALYRHTPAGGLLKQWEDITAPEVEALHAGASGDKVLIQVHRPRPAVDQRMFKDPALAVWHVGDPAPRTYDELFMNEQWNKGFVHLDVDKVESGEPFVFDSGAAPFSPGIIFSPGIPPPSAGGGDVVQEWGVVRASLKQRLILPSIGRVRGNFGSDWSTDVIMQNPVDAPQKVVLTFVPSGDGITTAASRQVTVTLGANEIRLFSDALSSVFSIDTGLGAMLIDPEAGVTVTSRTYSKAAAGTFGFGMNAVDAFAAAASPRFPITFSGAFPGLDYRTNLTLTDTSGHGSDITLAAAGRDGFVISGVAPAIFTAPPNGHQQINGITGGVGFSAHDTGALVVRPLRGSAVAAVYAVDNRTNDSTYFPADLPSSTVVRTIPAIGHLDGANGSKFRSDLYLYNPSDQPRVVNLQVKAWDVPEGPTTLQLTLLGNEARIIHDVLYTAFGRTGIARLRFQGSTTDSSGVRITSRTYNVDADGGTYGFLMPPLNNFQVGGSGDTLEILGAVSDPKFRVNIGLVELTGWPTNQNATVRIEILDATGKEVDAFTTNLPFAGGTQLNDVFRARSLTVTGPVLIRVTPTFGTVGAYATMTDNGTNDSVYLAANLAAKE